MINNIMDTTITQIQRLEKYILASRMSIDGIFSATISKLYTREVKRINQLIIRLEIQLSEFENQYSMTSEMFKQKYEFENLGDDIDFVEWSSTLDMLENAKKRQNIL